MDIFLLVAQTLGMEWKKRNKERKKMYTSKLCIFRNRLESKKLI